jgi:hypothetical protein
MYHFEQGGDLLRAAKYRQLVADTARDNAVIATSERVIQDE